MKEIDSVLNKTLLIGVTVLDNEEQLVEQFQTYGIVIFVDSDGITIKRKNMPNFVIPPDFNNIFDAEPGDYNLRETGETVSDPDFISTWTVNCASRDEVGNFKEHGFSRWLK